jgi:hypothetical protein
LRSDSRRQSDTIGHDTVDALPQGTNTTVEKALLQAPGVSQDSAASGLLHVRNDHANVQYRINGIMLPGIGVFAPQYGPRRGFFLGVSKKI